MRLPVSLKPSPEGEAMQQKSAAPFQEQRFYLLHRSIRYQNRQLPAYQSAAVLPVSETLGGRGQHHAVERRRGVNCKLIPGPSPTVSAQPMALV